MSNVPFLSVADDETHTYALATCKGLFVETGRETPAWLTIRFSPTEGMSRFLIDIYSAKEEWKAFRRGPDYTNAIEAVLIEALTGFGVPPAALELVPMPMEAAFPRPEHQALYCEARRELCLALYAPRANVGMLKSRPLFRPSEGAFELFDGFKRSRDNSEIFGVVTRHET